MPHLNLRSGGAIDLHCHVLPGVDDGPARTGESIALARTAVADGTDTIAATPHVDGAQPALDSTRIRAAVGALQVRLDQAEVPLTLVSGGELSQTRALELDDLELTALTLGGNGWLLLECPLSATSSPGFTGVARMLAGRGHRIVLAHPERSPLFLRSPSQLSELVALGMVAQVTAGALTGRFGRVVRDFAVHLITTGGAQMVASDGHDEQRPPRIISALHACRIDPALAEWLSRDVPAALLAGAELAPARPRLARGSRRRLLRR